MYVFPVYNFKCNELNLLKIKIKSALKDNYLKTCELNTQRNYNKKKKLWILKSNYLIK